MLSTRRPGPFRVMQNYGYSLNYLSIIFFSSPTRRIIIYQLQLGDHFSGHCRSSITSPASTCNRQNCGTTANSPIYSCAIVCTSIYVNITASSTHDTSTSASGLRGAFDRLPVDCFHARYFTAQYCNFSTSGPTSTNEFHLFFSLDF